MPKIKRGVVPNTLVSLPPIAEHQAIVERIDKIMAMIRELGKHVTDSKEQSAMLMRAVLSEAFGGGK